MEDQVLFKVFNHWGDGKKDIEVRRFGIDKSLVTSFGNLNAKLQEVFPTLKGEKFNVTWTDEEGDRITISSDEELMIALNAMTGELVKLAVRVIGDGEAKAVDVDIVFTVPQVHQSAGLYTNLKGLPDALKEIFKGIDSDIRKDADDHPHPSNLSAAVCDGCETPIMGFRYKCTTCEDYDLCAKCEIAGVHPQHCVLRLPSAVLPRHIMKAAIKRSRHLMKAAVEENKRQYRHERSAERKNRGDGDGSRSCPRRERGNRHQGWMNTMLNYINEFSNLAGDLAGDAKDLAGEMKNLNLEKQATEAKPAKEAQAPKEEQNAAEKPAEKAEKPAEKAEKPAEKSAEVPKAEPGTSKSAGQFQMEQIFEVLQRAAKTNLVQVKMGPDARLITNPMLFRGEVALPVDPEIFNNNKWPTETPEDANDEAKSQSDGNDSDSSGSSICVSLREESPEKADDWTVINKEKVLKAGLPDVMQTVKRTIEETDYHTNKAKLKAARQAAEKVAVAKAVAAKLSAAKQAAAAAGHLEPEKPQEASASLYPPLHAAAAALNPHMPEELQFNPFAAAAAAAPSAPPAQPQPLPKPAQPKTEPRRKLKPHVQAALDNMIAMGFTNEGDWLAQLLESKDGNIAAVLDLLTPVNPRK